MLQTPVRPYFLHIRLLGVFSLLPSWTLQTRLCFLLGDVRSASQLPHLLGYQDRRDGGDKVKCDVFAVLPSFVLCLDVRLRRSLGVP